MTLMTESMQLTAKWVDFLLKAKSTTPIAFPIFSVLSLSLFWEKSLDLSGQVRTISGRNRQDSQQPGSPR